MSGSREVHAPLFSRPMGGRGSAHRASGSRYLHTRVIKETRLGGLGWLARVDGSSSSFSSCSSLLCLALQGSSGSRVDGSSFSSASRPVLVFPGWEFWRARVELRRFLLSGARLRLASRRILPGCRRRRGRASRCQGDQPVVPILSGRDGACAILPPFGPNERAYQDDAEREVATPFLSSFIWVFV